MEDIMHKACLVELTGCTTIMCLLGYYILMVCLNLLRRYIFHFIDLCLIYEKHIIFIKPDIGENKL